MKRAALILMVATGLMGCKEFSGEFTVHEPIELKEHHLFGKDRRNFSAGEKYTARLEAVDSDTFKLKVSHGNKVRTFKFLVPDNSIPRNYGNFHVPASQVNKQNYGFEGIVDTDITNSDEHRGTESCSETFTVDVCVCKRDDEDRRYKSCHTEFETVWGSQDVTYYYKNTHTYLDADLIDGNNNPVASFKGDHYAQDKIYTFQSRCFLNRRPPRDRGRHLRCRGRHHRDGSHWDY